MEIALPHPRPGLAEVVGVLVACLLVFALIVKLDRAAADRAIARAQAATAERAQGQRAAALAGQPRRVTPRTESIGGRGPISIPLGGAWSAGTTTAIAHDAVHMSRGATPVASLRRIVGPDTASDVLAPPRTDAASKRRVAAAGRAAPAATLGPAKVFVEAPPASPAAATVSATASAGRGLPLASALLVALAVAGAGMAGAGAVLVSRRRTA